MVLALAVFLLALPELASSQDGDAGLKQAVVTVKGMSCPFCAYGIKKQLAKLSGVEKVDLDLAKSQATVDLAPGATVSDKQIQQAVRDAGFTPGKIEWRSREQQGVGRSQQAQAVAAIEGTG